jgi:hypothetical protein
MMELSAALKRVRQLIEKAEHPIAPGATAEEREGALREQANARKMADDIMERFAIEEWEALQKSDNRNQKPDRIKVDIGAGDSAFLAQTAQLVNIIADYCRCSSIWMKGSGWKGYREEYCWVYGYPSDLRYFELLYTTIYLHISGVINPKPDPSLSRGANIRELRNGGLNWNDIAEAYGWRLQSRNGSKTTYLNRETEEVATWSKVVGRIKSDYAKEIKARGEKPFTLGRGGAGNANFRFNAVSGYLVRIRQRLLEQQGRRGTGAEIILRDRTQNISAALAEDFPEMSIAKAKTPKFNPDAYARGVRHANTASLSPEATAGTAKGIS